MTQYNDEIKEFTARGNIDRIQSLNQNQHSIASNDMPQIVNSSLVSHKMTANDSFAQGSITSLPQVNMQSNVKNNTTSQSQLKN